jgi:hypothetical protein
MNLTTTLSAMNTKRTQLTATPLGGGGLILIVGGLDENGNPLASVELFDPATGVFTAVAASLATARYGHAAIVTPDGAVLVIGGQGTGAAYLASVEIFAAGARPEVTGTFATASTGLSSARANMRAAVLADGRILISGGADGSNAALNLAEIYSPGI